jgi:hypothetical protein
VITADTITDEQIRELRAVITKEWKARGRTTSWPEGKRILELTITALTDPRAMAMQIDDVRFGVARARARCAEILNARQAVTS